MPAPPEFLRQVRLFSSLSDDEVERLAETLKESRYSEGSEILTEGKGGLAFFVIGAGEVEYSVHGERVGSGGAGEEAQGGEAGSRADRHRAARQVLRGRGSGADHADLEHQADSGR